MNNPKFREIAQIWYNKMPNVQHKNCSENPLFEMLYDSYCIIKHDDGPYADFSEIGSYDDYEKICFDMFDWYTERYQNELNLKKGGRGQKRYVTKNMKQYSFDLLYCDDRQFNAYLLAETPQAGNQDLFCFILHTAVAFLVNPATLDKVLQKLGFHPLHVRNIHHLAIYTVLSDSQKTKKTLPIDYNPFKEVKELYDKANQILSLSPEDSPDAYTYDNKETKEIREWIFVNRGLSKENFIRIVQQNKTALNMRHSLIMDDFHKLSSVYSSILTDPEMDSFNYSFYQFVNRFCNGVSQKKFKEYMHSTIDKDTEMQIKHPTRQILILLCLYDFCFSFTKGVEMDPAEFEKMQDLLSKYHPEWARDAKSYYSGEIFDACGFINGWRDREIRLMFDGSEFVSWINNKLYERYGWGTLNPGLPFDHYILQLHKLCISYSRGYEFKNCGKIFWDSELLAKNYAGVENVPRSLVVISDIMAEVENIIGEKQSNLRPFVTQRIQQQEPELYKAERNKLVNLLSVIPPNNCGFIETTPGDLRSAIRTTLVPTLKGPEKEADKRTWKILSILLSSNGTVLNIDKKSMAASDNITVPSKYKAPLWEKNMKKVVDSLSQCESDRIEFTLEKLEDTVIRVLCGERAEKKNTRERGTSGTEHRDFVKTITVNGKAAPEQKLIMDAKEKTRGILTLILIHYSPVIKTDQHSLDAALDAEALISARSRMEEEIQRELDDKFPPFPLDCKIYEQI